MRIKNWHRRCMVEPSMLRAAFLFFCVIPLAEGGEPHCPRPLRSLPVVASTLVEKNIAYTKHGSDTLLLDLARPNRNGKFAALIFIHGGAWEAGSRTDYSDEILQAAQRGFVAATVDYRLASRDRRGRV